MYRHQLAILPVIKESGLFPTNLIGETETNANAKNIFATVVGNSYVDNLGFMREVRDAVFLHGTSEPTLLCLHKGTGGLESSLSTTITALSINIENKKHPKVWETAGLPADAYKVVATPDGGVLVFTGTAVLYIKQQTRVGICLHSECRVEAIPPLEFDPNKEPLSESVQKFASTYGGVLSATSGDRPPSYCDESNAEWNIDCSCASVAWLEDTIALVSFRHGELVTLKLVNEHGGLMRLVASKVASGPQPTCIARITDRLVFVGSRGGDSLLLSWRCHNAAGNVGASCTGKGDTTAKEGVDAGESDVTDNYGAGMPGGNDPRPKKRTKVTEDEVYEEYLESDLLSIYGELDGSTSTPSEIDVQVMDSIISLGAMRKLIAAPTGTDQDQSSDPTFIGCCGVGSNGALAILQRGLAPDIITTIPLPGLSTTWVISDAYLLLGFRDLENGKHQTKVLSAGAELQELTEEVDFLRDVETLAAGTLVDGSGSLEYQVHREGIRVLSQGKGVQELKVERGVERSVVGDNYVAIITLDGAGELYGVVGGKMKLMHQLPTMVHGKTAKICAVDIFEDKYGWLSSSSNFVDQARACTSRTFAWICYDNGELVICGVADDDSPDYSPKAVRNGSERKKVTFHEKMDDVSVLDPLWSSNGLASGVDIVTRESEDIVSWTARHIVDIKVECFDNTSFPILVAMNDAGSVFCYSMFKSRAASRSVGSPESLLCCLRLKRVRILIPSDVPSTSPISGGLLYSFHGIGEEQPYAGFFVAGKVPTWLIVNRGNVYVHQSTSSLSDVSSFSPFNNENCPRGFLAAARDGLVVANFAPRVRLDAQWPRRKLGIKSVPMDCAYYPEGHLIALVVAAPGSKRDFLPEDGESEAQAAYSYALASLDVSADGRMDSHEVRLVSPNSWKVMWTHQLLPGERSLCITAVHLKDQTSEATVPLLAVGTSFAAGEDYPCSGRVILVEVSKTDNGSWGGNVVFQREFKGPITNITSVEGYLLLSTGNRLETCVLKAASPGNFTLQRSAFYEGPSLITSLNVVKNFILVGDAQHSVQFLRYKDQGKQIMPLSKDFGQACVRACQFVIAGSSLHIIMADGEGNLRAFTYSPNDPKSWKGQKLDNWGALHVGKGISYMLRATVRHGETIDSSVADSVRQSGPSSKVSGAICVTDLGGLHMFVPLTQGEASNDVLVANEALSKALASSVANTAGLNPLAFRRRYQKSMLPLNGADFYDPPPALFDQGILDGDLLQSFLVQSTGFQDRLAQQLGLDSEKVAATCRGFTFATAM